MDDLIIETFGELFFFVYVLFDKNKHPMITLAKNTDN